MQRRVLEREGGGIELDDFKGHHHVEICPYEMTHSIASFSHPKCNPAYEFFFFFSLIEIIGSTNLIILLEDEIFADFFNTFLSLPVSILRLKSKCFINSQIVNITELSAFLKNK